MSKRIEFVKRKNLKKNLKKYNAFSVYGYYPLFSDAQTAEIVSPLTSYHIHEFEGVEYYMPEGLEMGKTQFHGDWKQSINQKQPIKCGIVTINTTISGGELRYFPNSSYLSSPGQPIFDFSTIQTITGLPSAGFIGDGVARYGDKLWIGIKYFIQGNSSFTGAPLQWYYGILELNFNPLVSMSASFSKVVTSGLSTFGLIAARCGVNSTTVAFSTGIGSNVEGLTIFDVSGTTAIGTTLFNTPPSITIADAVYIPNTDTWVLIEMGLGVTHRDSSGALLGNMSGVTWHSLFCDNGEIYMGSGGSPQIRKLDLTNYTQGPNIPISEIMSDAATDPECCNQSGDFPSITSWDCIQIGDHPKFGFKCTEVLGPQGPLGGQYATKQDCIDSGCEGVGPGPTGLPGSPSLPLPLLSPSQPEADISPLEEPEEETPPPPRRGTGY